MRKQALLQEAKPILFNTEMVKAILEGRKTVTRRLIKPNTPGLEMWKMDDSHTPSVMDADGRHYPQFAIKIPGYDYRGMILWVRETWMNDGTRYLYRANYAEDESFYCGGEAVEIKWKPSIHMPKEAARIFLRVTAVRAERLQEITTEDICREGVWVEPPPIVNGVRCPTDFEKRSEAKKEEWYQSMARATYIGQCDHIAALHRAWESLWNTTVKPTDLPHYGWAANPWVWVIEFERVGI